MIETLSDRFSVSWLCKQLAVARSGFYAWRQRQQNPGPRDQENAAMAIHDQGMAVVHENVAPIARLGRVGIGLAGQ